jgi:hypothetical protein
MKRPGEGHEWAAPEDCGADIFVDVNPLPGESPADFLRRRQELEEAARGLHAEQVEVVLGARQSRVPGAMAVAHPQPARNERPRHLFCTFNPRSLLRCRDREGAVSSTPNDSRAS